MKKLFNAAYITFVVCLLSVSILQAQTRGWGYNETGVLGVGNSTNQPTPQTVTALPDATGIGKGIDHTLFLRANGTLAVSGYNDFGQFGNTTPLNSNSPVAVPGLTNVVQASGAFHSVALLADGTVWAWGYNGEGQIGNGSTTTTGCLCIPTPTQASITGVVQIEAGGFHTLALKSDGTVWAWGLNDDGELGDNSNNNRSTPVQVGAGVAGFTNIIAIAAGDNHSMALKADGTVWVWGSNEFAQIGNGAASMTDRLSPVQNTTLSNITQIAAGVFHSMAQNKTGKVFVWGDNFYGQVGNGAASATPQGTPVQNATLSNVIEIDTAGFTNYARLADGSVRAWGSNDGGEIGNGTQTSTGCQCQPTPVQSSVGTGNTEVAAGWFHAFSLKPVIAVGVGTNQVLRGDNVRMTFANVTGSGNVAYTAVSAAAVAGSRTVPSGYTIQTNQPAYDVTTTTTTAGDIDVCIAGINEYSQATFTALRILHGEGSAWVDRTFSNDFSRRQICARVTSLGQFVISEGTPPSVRRAPYDFDGDGKTDVGVWRAPSGSWWYLQSSDLTGRGLSFGLPDDIITPGDYTGDGKADVAIWRPSTGEWFVRRSNDGSYYSYPFGLPGDIPAPADYDGDGATDTATFRPSTATWYIFNSSNGSFSILTFGLNGDYPVPADYDGDGKADIATWRASSGTWWVVRSSDLVQRGYGFGLGTDKPVVGGDYTGDGKADLALYRPSTSEWYFLRSEDNSYYSYPSGLPGDFPAPGDYDGDGKWDSAVFRPSTVTWYIDGSTAGSMILTFGLNGDRPVANAYVP